MDIIICLSNNTSRTLIDHAANPKVTIDLAILLLQTLLSLFILINQSTLSSIIIATVMSVILVQIVIFHFLQIQTFVLFVIIIRLYDSLRVAFFFQIFV